MVLRLSTGTRLLTLPRARHTARAVGSGELLEEDSGTAQGSMALLRLDKIL